MEDGWNRVGEVVGNQSWIGWDLGNWMGSWQLDGILAIGWDLGNWMGSWQLDGILAIGWGSQRLNSIPSLKAAHVTMRGGVQSRAIKGGGREKLSKSHYTPLCE